MTLGFFTPLREQASSLDWRSFRIRGKFGAPIRSTAAFKIFRSEIGDRDRIVSRRTRAPVPFHQVAL
jgi:hypothetical protein